LRKRIEFKKHVKNTSLYYTEFDGRYSTIAQDWFFCLEALSLNALLVFKTVKSRKNSILMIIIM